jgi:hypothetical protein
MMHFNWRRNLAVLALCSLTLLIFGCGGGGSVGGVSQQTPSTFTLSGKTSLGGTGLPGVTVAISGVSTSPVTDANGRFSADLANGNYTVTPTLAGYSFFPASQSMTVAGGALTVPDFTASAVSASFTVSGKATLSGAPLAGVQVTLTGAGTGSATTDAGGNYSFTGVHSGDCVVTAAKPGYTFNPLSQVVTVASADATVPDFSATASAPATFVVSGTVSLNGTGLGGVAVSITGAGSGTVNTAANGSYAFVGVRNGSYTVIPAINGYTFTPSSLALTVNGASLTGQDFQAVPPTGGSITIRF